VKYLFFNTLKEYLDLNLDNPELNADTVARAMSMSKSTLNRKLKTIGNSTISDFIKQYRLKKAVRMILSGHSIRQASVQVGFKTASYFSQCFKDFYRQTPTEFMKSLIN
jgi:AraC-like DNA-binding protein